MLSWFTKKISPKDFHKAAKDGDLKTMQQYIKNIKSEKNMDALNIADNQGNTALIIAANHSRFEVVRELLYEGADINHQNRDHQTAEDCARKVHGNNNVVQLLIEARETALKLSYKAPNLKASIPVVPHVQENKVDDNDINHKLVNAAKANDDVTVLEMLKLGANVNARDARQETPLIWASHNGNEKMVKVLLDAKADINLKNGQNSGQYTALMEAAHKGHVDVVCILIRAGADLKITNQGKQTAEQVADKNGKNYISELLKKAADKNKNLLKAAKDNDRETLLEMLKIGADVNARDDNDETPLIWAAHKGNELIIEDLLRANANINLKNGVYGGHYTALMEAVYEGYITIVERLILAGADLKLTNGLNETILDVAKKKGRNKIIELLQEEVKAHSASPELKIADPKLPVSPPLPKAEEKIEEKLDITVKTINNVKLKDEGLKNQKTLIQIILDSIKDNDFIKRLTDEAHERGFTSFSAGIIVDPVTIPGDDLHCFERAEIQTWIQKNTKFINPYTGVESTIGINDITTSLDYQAKIIDFIYKNLLTKSEMKNEQANNTQKILPLSPKKEAKQTNINQLKDEVKNEHENEHEIIQQFVSLPIQDENQTEISQLRVEIAKLRKDYEERSKELKKEIIHLMEVFVTTHEKNKNQPSLNLPLEPSVVISEEKQASIKEIIASDTTNTTLKVDIHELREKRCLFFKVQSDQKNIINDDKHQQNSSEKKISTDEIIFSEINPLDIQPKNHLSKRSYSFRQ